MLTTPRALATLLLATLPLAAHAQAPVDTDLDGTPDSADAFPCDWRRVGASFVPSEQGMATLLLEDNWPAQGDLDLNDAVVAYQHVVFRDAQGRATGLRTTIVPRAIGATLHTGLALHLPLSRGALRGATLQTGSAAPIAVSARTDETELVVDLAADLRDAFGIAAGFINTVQGAPGSTGDAAPIVVELDFASPVTLEVASDPFDLFFFRSDDRTHQIHRPRFAGTAVMNAALFGTADDGSTPTRHFVDRDGLPFVLDLPDLVEWPREARRVETLWPGIVAFAASGGSAGADFYVSAVAGVGFPHVGAKPVTPAAPYAQCLAPSCTDGVRNGSEADVDCGGSCGACGPGRACTVHAGCSSSACDAGLCLTSAARTCAVANGTGTQQPSGTSGWTACVATACSASYHVVSGACVPDDRTCSVSNGSGTQTWTGTAWSACTVTACNASFHLDGGACVSNTRTCAVSNGSGAESWSNGAWGACTVTGCNTAYHLAAGACVSNTRSCAVANGSGIETWTSNAWGSCVPTACNSGFHVEASACTSNTRACTLSNGPGIQLWSGSAWGVCLASSCAGLADGAPCQDTDACTSAEVCRSGACVGPSPSTFAVLEAPAITFAANTWTSPVWSGARMASGVAVSGRSVYFGSPGIYRVSFSYRLGNGGDVWTAVRLIGNGVVRGVSAGYGNTATYNPNLFTATFLTSVEDTAIPYEIQLGRLGSTSAVDAASSITGEALPTIQALVEKVDALPAAGTATYAQFHGNPQTFAANTWTPVAFTSAPLARQITAGGSNVSFTTPGVYRVTLSWRFGTGGEVWNGVRLRGARGTVGTSPTFTNTSYDPNLATVDFLARVDDVSQPYQLQIGRANSTATMEATPQAIAGTTFPAVQATFQKVGELPGVGTPLRAYAQLEGPAQVAPANAWTALSWTRASLASGIAVSGAGLTFPRAGVYRVTVSYRPAAPGDVWTSVRLHDGVSTRGIGPGYGALSTAPRLFTTTLLARVTDPTRTHQIQIGRLPAGNTFIAGATVTGEVMPAIGASIEELPTLEGCDDGSACTADVCDPTLGCRNLALAEGSTCENGDRCITDFCESGSCVSDDALACDDGNPCTAEQCSVTGGCASTPAVNGTACDDGSPTTTGDVCQVSVCAGTTTRPHVSMEAPVTTFSGNAWTSPAWNLVRRQSGIQLNGNNLTFPGPGVYRVNMTWRFGQGTDVWTAVRLYGDGAVRGVSAGFGNLNSHSPLPTEVSFLARIDNAATTYQVQVGRLSAAAIPIATSAIEGVALGVIQASVTRVGDLPGVSGVDTYAQMEGPAMTFNNGWNSVNWNYVRVANGVLVSGTNLTLDRTGVYRVTMSWRFGTGSDTWTALRLRTGTRTVGVSAGFGNAGNQSSVFTLSFLANVDDVSAPYNLQMGRLNGSDALDNPLAVIGVTPPAIQGTIERIGDLPPAGTAPAAPVVPAIGRAYGQFEAGPQTFPGNAWTPMVFSGTTFAAGISVDNRFIRFARPGTYRVSTSYRFGVGDDVWTAWRMEGAGTVGQTAGTGMIANMSNPVTMSFLVRIVDASRTYELQQGRLVGAHTISATPSPIGGVQAPVMQVSIEEL